MPVRFPLAKLSVASLKRVVVPTAIEERAPKNFKLKFTFCLLVDACVLRSLGLRVAHLSPLELLGLRIDAFPPFDGCGESDFLALLPDNKDR